MSKNNNGNNHHHNNTHHIYPRSRFPELAGDPNNRPSVVAKKHAIYHILFGNDPPEQITKNIRILFPRFIAFLIIAYLNKKFWGKLFCVGKENGNIIVEPLFKIEKRKKGKAEIVLKD